MTTAVYIIYSSNKACVVLYAKLYCWGPVTIRRLHSETTTLRKDLLGCLVEGRAPATPSSTFRRLSSVTATLQWQGIFLFRYTYLRCDGSVINDGGMDEEKPDDEAAEEENEKLQQNSRIKTPRAQKLLKNYKRN